MGVSSDYGKQLIVGNDRFKPLKLMDLLPTLLNFLCLIMNSTLWIYEVCTGTKPIFIIFYHFAGSEYAWEVHRSGSFEFFIYKKLLKMLLNMDRGKTEIYRTKCIFGVTSAKLQENWRHIFGLHKSEGSGLTLKIGSRILIETIGSEN